MDPVKQAGQRVTPRVRDTRIDALRGVALLLMILDHSLVVALAQGGPNWWLNAMRFTITRFSLPLFMVASGMLMSSLHGPSGKRRLQIGIAALWVNLLIVVLPSGFETPEILALWLFVGLGWKLIVRYPVEVVVVGLIQTLYLHIPYDHNYQPGQVAMWLALGVLASRLPEEPPFLTHAARLPKWIGAIGRHPLPWYVGHMTVLLWLSAAMFYAHQ